MSIARTTDPVATCMQCDRSAALFSEGVCESCCRENQWQLDQHYAEVARWDAMTDRERLDAIRRGYV